MPHITQSRSPASKKREAAIQKSPNPAKRRRVAGTDELKDSSASLEASTINIRESQTITAIVNQTKTSVKEEAEGQSTPNGSRLLTKKDKAKVIAQEADSAISSKRNTRSKKIEAALVREEQEVDIVESPQRPRRIKKVGASTLEQQSEEEILEPPIKSRKSKKPQIVVQAKEEEGEEAEQVPQKVKKHRKTKEEKQTEAMPLAARTNGLRMFIGAHVSCAKGILLLCG